jgi:predicted hotdog family 3-hydroxylacyl-ACP dehydratase
MKSCRYALADLLPHDAPLILLDRLSSYDGSSLLAEVDITDTSLFLAAQGVPSYIGIEYMAQACAAYVGLLAREAGEPVKIGFLLGTRNYKAHVPWFRRGQRLMVRASIVYRDEQMGAFACQIEDDATLAAEAQLSVYQADLNELLRRDQDEPE